MSEQSEQVENTPKKRAPREWVSSAKALERLTAHGESPVQMAQALAHFLKEGKIRARAKVIWISEEQTLVAAWASKPKASRERISVPTSNWRISKSWATDRDSWIWSDSRFYFTLRNKPKKRRLIDGVGLNIADLKACFPDQLGGKRKRRGPTKNMIKRNLVWKFLIFMARDGQLDDYIGGPDSELIGRIHDGLELRNGQHSAGRSLIGEVASDALVALQRKPDEIFPAYSKTTPEG